MEFANFKENIKQLKDHYYFSNHDFSKHFGSNYEKLLEFDISEIGTDLVDKSIDLTYAYQSISADERLVHIVDSLHQIALLSYQTIAAYGQISDAELLAYLKDNNSLSDGKKFNACARLSLLERTLTQNESIIEL
ncbi:HTH domain-containing protein [Listeria fleischmannii]|uniref:Uncharacterized protein n=1 Tax=Listeria fleischmannii TaxID=1069827 RepID=A0A841YET6_9LIST|nr:HTH domain-containing protein [Listeria fleischmannii]EIA19509.1 hypothetical protein KKC_12013 [Listeria fleischmannii subsp. coloradonensis]MBC1398781.1 hypothetical protein [Listeria fleischmannii]MBC1426876.1 hypothetical protein [Listeria fleischmannii]STY35868.1 Uncharacterised protein [Listeria fleischmannii subsp. coloradonensis]